MKITVMALTALLFTMCAAPPSVCTAWYAANPDADTFEISTAADLAGLARLVNVDGIGFNGKTIALIRDINLSKYDSTFNDGKGWIPIGGSGGIHGDNIKNTFQGVFDGNGKVVRGLFINDTVSPRHFGLFGAVTGGTVKNLGVTGVDIRVKGGYAGAVVGHVIGPTMQNPDVDSGRVINCHAAGTVRSKGIGAGGVAGLVMIGTIRDSRFSGTVSTAGDAGGVAGIVYYGNMANCYSDAAVTGLSKIGGVAGSLHNGNVTNSYSTGAVGGATVVVDGVSYVTGMYVGGVVGYVTYGGVTNSYSTGAVTGYDIVGGVVGGILHSLSDTVNISGSAVNNCYSTGAVSGVGLFVDGVHEDGGSYVGGVVGNVEIAVNGPIKSNTVVANSYAAGAVSGHDYVGGVIGGIRYSLMLFGGQRVDISEHTVDTSAFVSNSAALNPSVTWSGNNGGRVVGHINIDIDRRGGSRGNAATENTARDGHPRLAGLAAFGGMTITGIDSGGIGANTKNGASLTMAEIRADGTIGGRFTSKSGWTTQNGRLPGLFGNTVDMFQ